MDTNSRSKKSRFHFGVPKSGPHKFAPRVAISPRRQHSKWVKSSNQRHRYIPKESVQRNGDLPVSIERISLISYIQFPLLTDANIEKRGTTEIQFIYVTACTCVKLRSMSKVKGCLKKVYSIWYDGNSTRAVRSRKVKTKSW